MAFAVATAMILESFSMTLGAETLLGNGDMLFKIRHSKTNQNPRHLYSTEDTENVINAIKERSRRRG
jgi:hypothetical protein